MKGDRVIWCDRGWMPTFYGFCPSQRAWDFEMKRLRVKDPVEPYPTTDARCSTFDTSDGKRTIIVTVNERIDKLNDKGGTICLLVHEAMHVWRYILKDAGETEPSVEFEAYAMQNIVMGLCKAYGDTRKRLW